MLQKDKVMSFCNMEYLRSANTLELSWVSSKLLVAKKENEIPYLTGVHNYLHFCPQIFFESQPQMILNFHAKIIIQNLDF